VGEHLDALFLSSEVEVEVEVEKLLNYTVGGLQF